MSRLTNHCFRHGFVSIPDHIVMVHRPFGGSVAVSFTRGGGRASRRAVDGFDHRDVARFAKRKNPLTSSDLKGFFAMLRNVRTVGESLWFGRELNPRHVDFQSTALPSELPNLRILREFDDCHRYRRHPPKPPISPTDSTRERENTARACVVKMFCGHPSRKVRCSVQVKNEELSTESSHRT